MNTQQRIFRFYEVSHLGIRAVDDSLLYSLGRATWFSRVGAARAHYETVYGKQKPRVAPRMAIGVVVA